MSYSSVGSISVVGSSMFGSLTPHLFMRSFALRKKSSRLSHAKGPAQSHVCYGAVAYIGEIGRSSKVFLDLCEKVIFYLKQNVWRLSRP